jgi:hypothetical protein
LMATLPFAVMNSRLLLSGGVVMTKLIPNMLLRFKV